MLLSASMLILLVALYILCIALVRFVDGMVNPRT